jgi:hypothetical protein
MTEMLFSILAATLAASSGIGQQPRSDGAQWRTYANARFGYSLCYPRPFLRAGQEAPNGDGISLAGQGGGQVLVFGSNNVDGESLEHLTAATYKDHVLKGESVTYQRVAQKWAVLSGAAGSSVFYEKIVARDDQFITLSMQYPKKNQAAWGPIVSRMSRCLTIGTPAF